MLRETIQTLTCLSVLFCGAFSLHIVKDTIPYRRSSPFHEAEQQQQQHQQLQQQHQHQQLQQQHHLLDQINHHPHNHHPIKNNNFRYEDIRFTATNDNDDRTVSKSSKIEDDDGDEVSNFNNNRMILNHGSGNHNRKKLIPLSQMQFQPQQLQQNHQQYFNDNDDDFVPIAGVDDSTDGIDERHFQPYHISWSRRGSNNNYVINDNNEDNIQGIYHNPSLSSSSSLLPATSFTSSSYFSPRSRFLTEPPHHVPPHNFMMMISPQHQHFQHHNNLNFNHHHRPSSSMFTSYPLPNKNNQLNRHNYNSNYPNIGQDDDDIGNIRNKQLQQHSTENDKSNKKIENGNNDDDTDFNHRSYSSDNKNEIITNDNNYNENSEPPKELEELFGGRKGNSNGDNIESNNNDKSKANEPNNGFIDNKSTLDIRLQQKHLQQQQQQQHQNEQSHSNKRSSIIGENSGGGLPPNLPQVTHSQLLLRSARGQRQYDVPQIECPPAIDGMERFACPTPDRQGRYRCIDDHVLCDGFIDCPEGEDEDRQTCMFYKTTKAHLDVLADALLRWARGR